MKSYIILLSLFVLLVSQSCRKEYDEIDGQIHFPDPIVLVESSVFGQELDEENQPIQRALITYNQITTYSDNNGIFQFKNEKFNENGAFIKVEKENYFSGSRMIYPQVGSTEKVTIELMEKSVVGMFDNSVGGDVVFEEVELNFSSSSVEYENGKPYTGTVHVAAKYLDPTNLSTHNKMPGDLTAVNNNNEIVTLTSYAMIAVELMSDSGEKLQLKEGLPCKARIPVPASLQSTAPQEMEFWYFDDNLGRWKEEGMANYVNGNYEVDIPHFSFWNCDIPSYFINLKIQVYNNDGPFVNEYVRFTELETGSFRVNETNDKGIVSRPVPKNVKYLLELYSCGQIIHAEEIGPFSNNSEITVTFSYNLIEDIVNASGTISTCYPDNPDNTYIEVTMDNRKYFTTIDENQNFSILVNNCFSAESISARAIDPINKRASALETKTINSSVDFGNLELCDKYYSPIVNISFGDVEITTDITYPEPYAFKSNIIDVEENGEIIEKIFTIDLYNWWSGIVTSHVLRHNYTNTNSIQNFYFDDFGFNTSGQGESYIVNQDGEEFFVFSGELEDFTSTSPDGYDESYIPLTYYIVLENK